MNRSTRDVGLTGVTAAIEPSPAGTPGAQDDCRRVLVAFEPSACGRAGLVHAAELARARGVPLRVLSVTPQEREGVGCARCRQSAAMWNVEMAEVAREELREAAELLAPMGLTSADYVVGRGDPASAIAAAAVRGEDTLVVVPWERSRTLGILPRRTLADRLDAVPGLTVRCGPASSV